MLCQNRTHTRRRNAIDRLQTRFTGEVSEMQLPRFQTSLTGDCLQNRCVQKNHEECQRHVTLHLQMSNANQILRYGALIYVRQ